ncbi:MarR family transcriptional regulator [Micromonospora polyrhachis]|uniref:DNA-binding MarR family transcriptional regulator n=1 Tax=Micromonospora polyrhachis TaxID=1282883 RepID=A0A7W7SSU8_9ACTN|nr:MarR family transcriptional regulator [Micromonospora polyrhachis]MBB4960216.1 DNA-binding MarR family transcriptional regulator [Micromonospora polyrhachis]
MTQLTPSGSALSELVIEVFRANGLLLASGDGLARPAGLTSARWQVLGVVDHEPSTVSEVARVMGLTRQSVQQTADALARDGLVSFEENPRHRRAKLITITARGRVALDYVEQRQAEWSNRIAERATLDELHAATRTLRELARQLEIDAAHTPDDDAQPDGRDHG